MHTEPKLAAISADESMILAHGIVMRLANDMARKNLADKDIDPEARKILRLALLSLESPSDDTCCSVLPAFAPINNGDN